MKKTFMMALALSTIALVSCGKSSANDVNAEGNDTANIEATAEPTEPNSTDSVEATPAEPAVDPLSISFEGGTRYENEKYGYSVAIPAGFNEIKEDKPSEYGKAFNVKEDGKLIDYIEANFHESSSPAADLKRIVDWVTPSDDAQNLVSDVKDDKATITYFDGFTYHAIYVVTTESGTITLTLKGDKTFSEESVNKIIESLYVKPQTTE